jgi:hypothetical protein
MKTAHSGPRSPLPCRLALIGPIASLGIALGGGGCGSSDGSLPPVPTVDNRDPEVKEADDLMQAIAKKGKSGGAPAARAPSRGRAAMGGAPEG